MSRSARTVLSTLGILLLAAGTLAGCATAIDAGGTPSGSAAPDDDVSNDLEVDAAWLDGGRMIGLVTLGSSTCIPTAGEATFANGVIDVELVEPAEDTACTRDLVPRVSLFATPEGVDPTQDLEIRVAGANSSGDVDLDGVAGLALGGETDYLPSAGWTGEDGQFVVLSWGSSTCVPVFEQAVASGASEVTVTFATPPADQVCTMDMVPRGVVAQVADLEDDGEVFAILQGGEFDDIRIPIVGSD